MSRAAWAQVTAKPNLLVNRTLHGIPAWGIISFLPKPGMPFRAGYRGR